jgi:hypothetical protein
MFNRAMEDPVPMGGGKFAGHLGIVVPGTREGLPDDHLFTAPRP